MLKAAGLVVDRGRKGQMVAPVEPDRLSALYQVRDSLDRLAAQLAAAHVPGNRTARQQLEQLIERGCAAAEKGEISDRVNVDVAFHRLLHSTSGNAEIDTITELLWPHLQRSLRTVLEHRDYWLQDWCEHREIANAVIASDTEHAGTLAANHAEAAGKLTHQRLHQRLQQPGACSNSAS